MAAKTPKTKYCRYEGRSYPVAQFRETARNGWVHQRPGGLIPLHTVDGDVVGSSGGGSGLPMIAGPGIARRIGRGLPAKRALRRAARRK